MIFSMPGQVTDALKLCSALLMHFEMLSARTAIDSELRNRMAAVGRASYRGNGYPTASYSPQTRRF
jgi:hypothetical protein